MNQQMARMIKGRFSARVTVDGDDILAAQHLRTSQFGTGTGPDGQGRDADQFDDICRHVLIEDIASGELAACFRFLHLTGGAEIERSYAAVYYNLARLKTYPDPVLEIGRFCIDPNRSDPDILRIAWAMLTRYVDVHRIGMMFGCSSFGGTDISPYKDAYALLKDRHLAPRHWSPGVKAPSVIRYARDLAHMKPDLKQAGNSMPPLLRTYLAMGGWVSDHAVIDRQLDTLHVFTAVEISAIPAQRKRLLRADAA